MSGHIVPRRTYFVVSVLLAILLVLTLAAAWWIDVGRLNVAIAIGIATAKAVLIVLYFMHVRYSPPLVRLAAVGGFVWLAVLLILLLADYIARGWIG